MKVAEQPAPAVGDPVLRCLGSEFCESKPKVNHLFQKIVCGAVTDFILCVCYLEEVFLSICVYMYVCGGHGSTSDILLNLSPLDFLSQEDKAQV